MCIMWNLIFLVIAVVVSVTIAILGFKAQAAMTQLHKSFPDVNEKFIKEQKKHIMFLMLMGVALCGVVIIINIPSFAVQYSIWHGITIIVGSMVYAIICPVIIKNIRA